VEESNKYKIRESWNMERLKEDVTATKYLNQNDINIENATPEDENIQGI